MDTEMKGEPGAGGKTNDVDGMPYREMDGR